MSFPADMDDLTGPVEQTQPALELKDAIAEARVLAHEQVAAAWQLHLERIREQLDTGWRESLEEIFEQRFGEIETRLQASFDDAVAARAQVEAEKRSGFVRDETRRELTENLNNALRRLRQSEDRSGWVHTLLDATMSFAGKAALFAVSGRMLRLEGARGADAVPGAEIPLASAPAFAAVVDSMDTVVAAGTSRELSQTVSGLLGDASASKVYLFPLVLRHKPVAFLYAEPSAEYAIDVSAIELLGSLAAASINIEETTVDSKLTELVRISGAPAPRPSQGAPWQDLSKAEQEAHLKAQRFARTRIAEMVLRRMATVREGRAARDLYGRLREEIDAGREAFRRQFIDTCPSMVDYFHLELVRTLAKDDGALLGSDYPGPLP